MCSEFSDAMKKASDFRKNKDYSSAIIAYTEALENSKNDTQKLSCKFAIGSCYFQNKEYTQSLKHFDEVITLEETQNKPNNARINSTLNHKVNAYKKLENYPLAIETLRTLISRESLSEPMKKVAEKELAKLSNTTDDFLSTTPNQAKNSKTQKKELAKHSNKTDSSSATSPIEAENSKASENEKDSIKLDESPVLNPKPKIINI